MGKKEGKKMNRGSAGQNKKKSSDFLEKNRKKNGVFETASGLQYEIVKEMSGAKPNKSSIVTVHQRAMLLGGKILDDTYKENKPMEFNLSDVIDGYREGLMMMSTGSRYRFFVPPELGWGKKGSGGRIGPYSVVIFDVALQDFY